MVKNSMLLQNILDRLGALETRQHKMEHKFLATACRLVELAVNDYLELEFYHDDGGAQEIQFTDTFLEVLRIF